MFPFKAISLCNGIWIYNQQLTTIRLFNHSDTKDEPSWIGVQKLLHRCLQLAPGHSHARLGPGARLSADGRHPAGQGVHHAGSGRRSRGSCLKAVHSEKGYEMAIDFLKVLGYIYISKIKYDEAEWIFRHLKAFRPEEATVGIGDVWWSRGNMTEARFYFNDAQRINPNFAPGWLAEGDLLDYWGYYDEALEVYDIATKKDPNLTGAWCKKADILFSLGKHEDAIKCFNKSLEINSQNSDAWFHKSESLRSLGRITEADIALAKACKLGYKDATESTQN